MKKKLDIVRLVENAPDKPEPKKPTSVRVSDSDKELLLNHFGSLQRAVDALIKEIKGW